MVFDLSGQGDGDLGRSSGQGDGDLGQGAQVQAVAAVQQDRFARRDVLAVDLGAVVSAEVDDQPSPVAGGGAWRGALGRG
jgi:hypothetical protein